MSLLRTALTTVATAAVLAVPSAAHASGPSGPDRTEPREPGLRADVPTCVSARYENPIGPYQDVYVTNDCPVTQRIKVIWAFARDSACHSIDPGDTYKDHHLNQAGADRWDGLETC